MGLTLTGQQLTLGQKWKVQVVGPQIWSICRFLPKASSPRGGMQWAYTAPTLPDAPETDAWRSQAPAEWGCHSNCWVWRDVRRRWQQHCLAACRCSVAVRWSPVPHQRMGHGPGPLSRSSPTPPGWRCWNRDEEPAADGENAYTWKCTWKCTCVSAHASWGWGKAPATPKG